MSKLFTPLTLRSLTFPNRVFVSPMCQYSSENGMPNEWHSVHLCSRAVGGAGFVCVEAAGVSPEGRITPWDAGIWSAEHARAWKPIAAFARAHGSVPGIQLAHAGRKASCAKPWEGGKPLAGAGAWETLGPSAIPFGDYPAPRAMSVGEIEATIEQFRRAAGFALDAGFDVVEVHGAHGYLLHSFCSALSNQRNDAWGGSLDNRLRLPLAVASAVRAAWPADKPVFYRLSATDWAEGGWDLAQSIELSRRLKAAGIDLIDCSSGGNIANHQKIPLGPGYQVPFSDAIRREAAVPTAAVGLITDPVQAEQIVSLGQADAVCLARAMLRDPYWPRHAAQALRAEMPWPDQYKRAAV